MLRHAMSCYVINDVSFCAALCCASLCCAVCYAMRWHAYCLCMCARASFVPCVCTIATFSIAMPSVSDTTNLPPTLLFVVRWFIFVIRFPAFDHFYCNRKSFEAGWCLSCLTCCEFSSAIDYWHHPAFSHDMLYVKSPLDNMMTKGT